MTQAISHYSRYDDADIATGTDGKYHYKGDKRLNAEKKIKAFYTLSITSLIGLASVLFVVSADAAPLGRARAA